MLSIRQSTLRLLKDIILGADRIKVLLGGPALTSSGTTAHVSIHISLSPKTNKDNAGSVRDPREPEMHNHDMAQAQMAEYKTMQQ